MENMRVVAHAKAAWQENDKTTMLGFMREIEMTLPELDKNWRDSIADKPVGVVPIVSSEIVRPIAVEIVKALKNPRVLRWTTWDVFAGRQINHERGLSEEEAVIEVLKRHWPNKKLKHGE